MTRFALRSSHTDCEIQVYYDQTWDGTMWLNRLSGNCRLIGYNFIHLNLLYDLCEMSSPALSLQSPASPSISYPSIIRSHKTNLNHQCYSERRITNSLWPSVRLLLWDGGAWGGLLPRSPNECGSLNYNLFHITPSLSLSLSSFHPYKDKKGKSKYLLKTVS